MSGATSLTLAIAAVYVAAIVIALILWIARGRLPSVLLWCLAAIPLACLFIVPAKHMALRGLVAFLAAECSFKLIDFWSRPSLVWNITTWREFLSLLVPFPALSIVYPEHRRRLAHADARLPHALRIVIGGCVFVAALTLIRQVEQMPAMRNSSVLTHIVRVAIFIPAIEALSQVLYALERLAGFDTRPIIHRIYLARTIGDFWRRYNYRVHDWLFRHVFLPSGGRKHPARAVLLVFIFSGAFHEAAFAMATSQWTGYQFAFFAIQGPAAVASSYLDKVTKRFKFVGALVSHVFTILFLVASSVLFFDGVCKVFPMILVNGSPLP